MNKRFLILASLILVVCFSAGVFTEIVAPADKLSLPSELPALAGVILDYIKDDFLTVLAALIFSSTVFLAPLVLILICGKTFSLGFSAAYILSSFGETGFRVLLGALLPRGLFKIPAYIALLVISFETAAFVARNYKNHAALKGALPHLWRFLICFLALAASSLLEALLLQGVL